MWISRRLEKENAGISAERGYVSMNKDGRIEAASSVNSRDTAAFSPYGYTAAVPRGEEVLLIPSNDGQVVIGTKSESKALEAGEIKIASLGGASIVLKNDGSVIINGKLTINREGVISRGV